MMQNIYFDQNKKHIISQVEIWTPNSVKASEYLMQGVISTLQNQKEVLLEHVNQEERAISLLCSSLAWLVSLKHNSPNSDQYKNLKIVYASPDQNQLQQVEGYLQKTIYRPKINYLKDESGTAEIKDSDLIFVTYENLFSCQQENLTNSILIFDNYYCFQGKRCLSKISVETIKNSQVQLKDLTDYKLKNNSFVDVQWFSLTKRVMQFLEENLEENYSYSQERIMQILIEQFKKDQSFKEYQKSFNEYVSTCQEYLKFSNYLTKSNILKLTSLIDWFKFIQIVQEWDKNKQYYQGNYSFINPTQKDINLKKPIKLNIYLNYYSQYVLDHLRKLKFQSIIISSKSLFSPYDNFLNKIQIKHKIDQSEYFQTFFVQSNDKWLSLFNTLNKIQTIIPNSIVVIFQNRTERENFQKYCENQKPNILKEIEKHKKLFWGDGQPNQKKFISSSREGAILFEAYEGISRKKVYQSPNSFQFCNGLILVNMNEPTNFIQKAMDLKYFQNRSFNNVVQKILLQENKNRVLIIFDKKEELHNWVKTCDIFQVNYFEASNPFLFEMIEKNFKDSKCNQIQIEKEVNQNNVTQNNQQTRNQLNNIENSQDDEMEQESEESSIAYSRDFSIDNTHD